MLYLILVINTYAHLHWLERGKVSAYTGKDLFANYSKKDNPEANKVPHSILLELFGVLIYSEHAAEREEPDTRARLHSAGFD